jgi:SAM-dependent methyltransferase
VRVETATELAARWRADLAAWEIPEEILRQVPDSPWVLPERVFVRRAERQLGDPVGVSAERALEALSTPGTVLDVGAGGGAAGLPLAAAGRATGVVAVDVHAGMLAELVATAARVGVRAVTVEGRWPDVADQVAPADVVVCHNVLYNVPDLVPFVEALTRHARRRVVVELTARHPMVRLNPLWRRFHDLDRPEGPTAEDALAVLLALGLDARAERWSRQLDPLEMSFDEAVEVTRRRLCLPPDRSEEVADALRTLGQHGGPLPDPGSPGQDLVTIWWPGRAGAGAAD